MKASLTICSEDENTEKTDHFFLVFQPPIAWFCAISSITIHLTLRDWVLGNIKFFLKKLLFIDKKSSIRNFGKVYPKILRLFRMWEKTEPSPRPLNKSLNWSRLTKVYSCNSALFQCLIFSHIMLHTVTKTTLKVVWVNINHSWPICQIFSKFAKKDIRMMLSTLNCTLFCSFVINLNCIFLLLPVNIILLASRLQ